MACGSGLYIRDEEGRLRTLGHPSRRPEIGIADARWAEGTRNRSRERHQEAARIEVMVAYRVKLTPDDNDTLLVTCPKIPMVTTFGSTREEALAHAVDAIETALASMIADDEPIPAPDGGDHLRPDE